MAATLDLYRQIEEETNNLYHVEVGMQSRLENKKSLAKIWSNRQKEAMENLTKITEELQTIEQDCESINGTFKNDGAKASIFC